jgi:hypothetical protein
MLVSPFPFRFLQVASRAELDASSQTHPAKSPGSRSFRVLALRNLTSNPATSMPTHVANLLYVAWTRLQTSNVAADAI